MFFLKIMVSPLEQFQIRNLLPLYFDDVNLSFTNSSLFMLLVVFVVFLMFLILIQSSKYGYASLHSSLVMRQKNEKAKDAKLSVKSNSDLGMGFNTEVLDIISKDCGKSGLAHRMIPGSFAVCIEFLYSMIIGMAVGIAGERAKNHLALIFTIFIFIMLCNLLGMFPGSFTVTSHIVVTFTLAIFVFFFVTILGFVHHGFGYFNILLPSGTPKLLMPLMFVIELFAYLARPVSLSLRLAANMTAGHIVLKVIASFVVLAGFFGILPFILLVLLTGFEIFIAILQAYIFAILTCAYLNDALNMH